MQYSKLILLIDIYALIYFKCNVLKTNENGFLFVKKLIK